MKRIINILTAAVAVVAMMSGCNAGYGELRTGYETGVIEVTGVQTDYSAFPATSRLSYDCSEEVTVSSNQAWCKVTKIKDGEMELKVDVNKTIMTRSAKVSLMTAGGEVVQIPIIQRGVVLKTSESSLTVPNTANVVQITVDVPIEFEYEASDWLASFCSVEGNVITINFPEHSGFSRFGNIDISIDDPKLQTSVSVEQMGGNLTGLSLAEKFIGTGDELITWYFDPNANNGSAFNSSWITARDRYKHREIKIGRLNIPATASGSAPTGVYQAIQVIIIWDNAPLNYPTGFKIEMKEGATDDKVVFTFKTETEGKGGMTNYWQNDIWSISNAGMGTFLTNFTGWSFNSSKTYAIVNADSETNPTFMTLRDVDNRSNWFTVTKTPVQIH